MQTSISHNFVSQCRYKRYQLIIWSILLQLRLIVVGWVWIYIVELGIIIYTARAMGIKTRSILILTLITIKCTTRTFPERTRLLCYSNYLNLLSRHTINTHLLSITGISSRLSIINIICSILIIRLILIRVAVSIIRPKLGFWAMESLRIEEWDILVEWWLSMDSMLR